MTPGPMEFRGPIRRPNGLLGPIKMTLTNQFVKDRRLFWGGRSHENLDKVGPFCLGTFFFGNHMKILRKLGHLPFLFWTTQIQSCMLFELTPGPRVTLDAPWRESRANCTNVLPPQRGGTVPFPWRESRANCTNVLPPQRSGAFPSPVGVGRNGRTDLPRGSTKRSPPLSRTVFSLGRLLTGHNWTTPILLIDRTPFWRFLILALLLIGGNVHPNPGPISNHPHPNTPAPSAIWMWAEILFNALLASSGCISFAPPLPVLTFAQSVQLALQSGDVLRAIPKGKLAPPLRPVSLLRRLRPLHPLLQGSPTTAWLLSITSTSGLPTLPLLHLLSRGR